MPAPALEPVVLTRLEAMLATPNAVVTADFYRIDMRYFASVTLDAVVATELTSRSRVKGLRIGVREEVKSGPRFSSSFVDADEAASLSAALASLADLAANWTGREEQRSTDVSFRTVGGVAVGLHESGRVQKASLSSGLVDPVGIPLEIAELLSLKQAVDQALGVLANK